VDEKRNKNRNVEQLRAAFPKAVLETQGYAVENVLILSQGMVGCWKIWKI
jgi:hypothetical protein